MNWLHIFQQGFVVGREDFRRFWNVRTWTFSWLPRILTSAAILVLVGKLLGSEEHLQYLLVGNASIAGVGTFAIGMATSDRIDGTYQLQIAAPGSMIPALLGRLSVWAIHWFLSGLAAFIFLIIAFEWRPSFPNIVFVPIGLFTLTFSSYMFSVFLGSLLASKAPSTRNIAINVFIALIASICGVSVPVTFWPEWVQLIANIIPTTHGIAAIREILAGESILRISTLLGWELGVGAAWGALAFALVDRMAERARATGGINL